MVMIWCEIAPIAEQYPIALLQIR